MAPLAAIPEFSSEGVGDCRGVWWNTPADRVKTVEMEECNLASRIPLVVVFAFNGHVSVAERS
jgi:hypothetical protein